VSLNSTPLICAEIESSNTVPCCIKVGMESLKEDVEDSGSKYATNTGEEEIGENDSSFRI